MNNDGLFFDVIEDNLVQLRHDIKGERPECAAEGESRLLSNLAVLIAAGSVENPALYCAELLGRLDEIRLFSGNDLEMLDLEHVREDMGSHRFTYLHLHQGEVYAVQAVVKAEARPSPTLVPRTTAVVGTVPKDRFDPLCNEWPLQLITYDARHETLRVRLACGVEWCFYKWDKTPSKTIHHGVTIPTQEIEIVL